MNEDEAPRSGALGRARALLDALKGRLVEREEVVDGALAALVANQHVLLLGPPGTAKSLLARLLCESVEGGRYFGRLLTRFSTPEELFGPLDLRALEDGRYERCTEGYLPTAHVAFLDEVFKASSAILNALLGVMNERVFHNGPAPSPVPLLCLVGASNEVPDEPGLAALYDRFLVRYWVEAIEERAGFLRMIRAPDEGAPLPRLSLADIAALREAASAVAVDELALETLFRLRRSLAMKGIFVSDRRYRQAVGFLQARALLEGAPRVGEESVRWLGPCLWSDPEERAVVAEALDEVLAGFDREADELVARGREVMAFAQRRWDSAEEEARAMIEAHAKLTRLLGDAERLVRLGKERGRVTDRVREAREALATLLETLVREGF